MGISNTPSNSRVTAVTAMVNSMMCYIHFFHMIQLGQCDYCFGFFPILRRRHWLFVVCLLRHVDPLSLRVDLLQHIHPILFVFPLSTIHTCNLLVFISSWCNAITSGINSAVIGLFLFMIVFNSLTSCPSLLCNGFKGFTSSRSWAVALCTTCYMFRSHCHCFNCSFNVQISSSLLVSIPVANEHVDCIDTILHCHFFKCIAFVRFSPTEQNIVFMQF